MRQRKETGNKYEAKETIGNLKCKFIEFLLNRKKIIPIIQEELLKTKHISFQKIKLFTN